MTDINLPPTEELPAHLESQASAAEPLDAARPCIEAVRDYVKEHGQLPPEYEDTPDRTDTIVDDAPGRRGAA